MKILFTKRLDTVTRVIASILSVAFVLLIIGPVFLYAQQLPTPPTDGDPFSGTEYDFDNTSFAPLEWNGVDLPPGQLGPTRAEADTALANAAVKKAAENQAAQMAQAFSCLSGGGPFTLGLNIKGCVANIMDLAMWLAAHTLWIAGVLLNITLDYTLNLDTLLQRLPIVDIGWKVLRDIANIVFIFITLWCGISITLGIGDGGKKAWGYLAQMVLVALFINFSLFITKAVVDASNIAALHFYALIVDPTKDDPKKAKKYDSGLSEAFMYGLKLSTIYNSKQIGSGQFNADTSQTGSIITTPGNVTNGQGLSFTNIILIGFFGSLFIIVAAWVFFAAAIMFIYRAITLIFLMILSPLAFVGLILPGASGMAHAWWSKLWSQAFFAPLYLALAYVVVRTINTTTFQGAFGATPGEPTTGFAAALTGTGASNVGIIFNFVILIGFMVACLVVAQSLGAKGSEMAMAGWEKIKGGALGVTGATVRGVIKAPSGGIRALGNTGAARAAAGRWMANTSLLHGGLLRNTAVSRWAANRGTNMERRGQEIQEGRAGLRRWTNRIGNAVDVRHLEERAGKSWLGNTVAGKALRGMTTGALANMKIGDKSLQESYEEGIHNKSARMAIEERGHAIEGADEATEARKQIDAAKREHADLAAMKDKAGVASTIAAYEAKVAAGTPVTDDERRQYDTAKKHENESDTEFAQTLKNSEGTVQTREQSLAAAKDKISSALGKMSTQEFLHLMPREYLKNRELMNINVLGEDKYNALMEDEHFSEEEKERYTHARYADVEEESHTYREKYDEWQKAQVEHTKELSNRETKRTQLERSLKNTDLGDNFKDKERVILDGISAAQDLRDDAKAAGDNVRLAEAEELIAKEEAALKNLYKERSKSIRNSAAFRIEEQRAGLRDAKGNDTTPQAPKAPDWKDKDVYRGLRNMRNIRELENVARFMPHMLEQERFVSTLSQGMVDRFRESTKVGSAQKTQVRMNKSYYMTETNDLILGLDPHEMNELEAKNPQKAAEVRKERNDMISNNKQEFETTFLYESTINATTGKRERTKDASGNDIRIEEAWARHLTGERLMPEMTGHKADDEISKMMGAQRNLYGVRKHMGRGATKQFGPRDEGDDKRPIVQFMLDQLKQKIEGTGDITAQNIESLKWFINDRDGKNFANFDLLEGRYKELMEITKAIYGVGDQALHSQFSKKEALKKLGEMSGRTLTYAQARELFKIAGDEQEYKK